MNSLLMTALTCCGILLGLAVTPAKAVTVDVSCTGSAKFTYSPGLKVEPQMVTFAFQVTLGAPKPCQSTDANLSSGSSSGSGKGSRSCVEPLSVGSFPAIITWNNGRTSTLATVFTSTDLNGILVATGIGTVSAGEFKGDTVLLVITIKAPTVFSCESPLGVTEISGVITFSITRL